MTPEALARWIGAIRTAQPSLSLTAVEALLWVAAGIDNGRELAEQMDVDRATITRTLGALRGRSAWAQGRWRESPLQLLQTRPHPHISGALCHSLSPNGQELIKSLSSGEITELHPCNP